MADTKETSELRQMKSPSNEELTHVYSERIYSYMKELSGLVVNARLQAKEADIRAKYALEFATRAAGEAQLAHQVAGALARTSRMVAALALEFTDNFDECIDSFSESNIDSTYQSYLDGDTSQRSAGDSSILSEGWSFDTVSTPEACINDSVKCTEPGHIKPKSLHLEGVPANDMQMENSVSSKPSEERPEADDNAHIDLPDDKNDPDRALIEDLKHLEVKRKMRIYRDSKLAETKLSEFQNSEMSFPEKKDHILPPNITNQVTCM